MRLIRIVLLAAVLAMVVPAAMTPKPCALAAATGGGFTFNLSLCPATLVGGAESWGNQVLLDIPPGDPGINLALFSDSAAATVPLVVNVPGGSTTQIFHIQTSPVTVVTQVRITLVYAGVSTDAFLTLTPAAAEACAANVSSAVSVKRGGFRYVKATRRYVQTVSLRNNSATAIAGPVSLVLTSLSANAALFNKSGVTACLSPPGSSYLEVAPAGSSLAPGGTRNATLEFTNTNNRAISYSTLVASGGNR